MKCGGRRRKRVRKFFTKALFMRNVEDDVPYEARIQFPL